MMQAYYPHCAHGVGKLHDIDILSTCITYMDAHDILIYRYFEVERANAREYDDGDDGFDDDDDDE